MPYVRSVFNVKNNLAEIPSVLKRNLKLVNLFFL